MTESSDWMNVLNFFFEYIIETSLRFINKKRVKYKMTTKTAGVNVTKTIGLFLY